MRKSLVSSPVRHNRSPSGRPHLGVLFTCIGRRIELADAFRRAAAKLNIRLTIHGADMTWFAPALHHVDRAHIVPALCDSNYLDALVEIIRKNRIDLAIPLIDSELMLMSEAWERLDAIGCRVVISSEDVIHKCQDKLLTFEVLKKAGIDTPKTWSYREALRRKRHRFPYMVKPREGSAGQGNFKVDHLAELKVLCRRVHDPIVQEFVEGWEHTLDVYTGLDGIPRCVVPRRRLEVRSGEVSKGMVVKDPRIMAVGRRVATALGDCRGVVTVQCMVTPDQRIRVIEINPRFGGGVPLAINAGADFPKWLMAQHLGRRVRINPTGFKDKITMLRYDQSVFCSLNEHQAF